MTRPVTVADAMLRHPRVHPAALTVAGARAAYAASAKTHLLLLVDAGVLVSTLARDDVREAAPPSAPAAGLGVLDGRIVSPGAPLEPTARAMARARHRRLAVVDARMRLLGLLCLKRSLDGFCTDEAVAAMRAARTS